MKELLDDRYNTNFKVQFRANKQLVIVGHDHQTRILLKDIDSKFPDSMSRKSNIWRDESSCFYTNEPKQFYGYKNKKELKYENCQ